MKTYFCTEPHKALIIMLIINKETTKGWEENVQNVFKVL